MPNPSWCLLLDQYSLVSQPQSDALTGAYGQMEALISSMSKLNASNAAAEAAAEAAAANTPPVAPAPAAKTPPAATTPPVQA